MRVEISSSAKEDIKSAYYFYEQQQEGLGRYFVNSLQADIDSLEFLAGVHPKYLDDTHRMLTKRFPYAVYYTVALNVAEIIAILDCRSNPKKHPSHH